jgi:hypothetical protein
VIKVLMEVIGEGAGQYEPADAHLLGHLL